MNDKHDKAPHSPEDAALDRAIQALPRSQLPTRDLWPELQARLPRRAARRTRLVWAAVATLAALYLSVWLRPDHAPSSVTVPSLVQADTMSAEASLMQVYESQKAAQLASLTFINPAVNRQLAVWDGAVQQVRGALRYYPDQPQLLQQLDRLYRQQLHYLEALAMLDPQVAAYY